MTVPFVVTVTVTEATCGFAVDPTEVGLKAHAMENPAGSTKLVKGGPAEAEAHCNCERPTPAGRSKFTGTVLPDVAPEVRFNGPATNLMLSANVVVRIRPVGESTAVTVTV